MIGIITVRAGRLTLGAGDVALWSDEIWLVGDGVEGAPCPPRTTRRVELGSYAPAAWSAWLAGEITEASVALSAAPDGRDLAGRMAEILERQLFAGCLAISEDQVVTPLFGGASTAISLPKGAFVATLQATGRAVALAPSASSVERPTLPERTDVRVSAVLEPDLDSVDLADADRIVAGGAGLSGEAAFEQLAELGSRLGAAMGATRVITDRGWVPFRRQIGTTGATVSPTLYVAFGISGAVQHTSGLGSPEHVVSVNLDSASPMSKMADLAIVADATATLQALLERTEGES